MKEEWLFPGAIVPVDVGTTSSLVAEIRRLIDVVGSMALKEPVLQDSEQYRMQMAAICTAAIGYWTEYDSIGSDYDTVALRDVAKLYAKYDALYKAQPEQEPVATVTSETGADITMSWWHEPALPIGTKLYTSPPAQRTWVGLTYEEQRELYKKHEMDGWGHFYNAIEAKLKEKNT